MANPRPPVWQCHDCGAGPYLRETTPACIQCGHKMCPDCKRDGDIPNTLGTVLRSPLTAAKTTDYSAMRRTAPAMAPRGNKRALDHGQYHQQALRLTRPPLTGWWICSKCGNENDPDLTDGRCSICNHAKCGTCRPC